jgi:CRISPR/Cas system-associated endoribonuclease Cas2
VDWVQYSFYVSMLEVYNDQLRDLIHEPAPPARRGDPVVRPKVGRFVAAYSD